MVDESPPAAGAVPRPGTVDDATTDVVVDEVGVLDVVGAEVDVDTPGTLVDGV